MTKIWIKWKESSARIWDYDLIDLDEIVEDFGISIDGKVYWEDEIPSTHSIEIVDQLIRNFMNDYMMSMYPDRWGGSSFDHEVLDKPPLTWYEDQAKSAKGWLDSAQRTYDHAIAVLEEERQNATVD